MQVRILWADGEQSSRQTTTVLGHAFLQPFTDVNLQIIASSSASEAGTSQPDDMFRSSRDNASLDTTDARVWRGQEAAKSGNISLVRFKGKPPQNRPSWIHMISEYSNREARKSEMKSWRKLKDTIASLSSRCDYRPKKMTLLASDYYRWVPFRKLAMPHIEKIVSKWMEKIGLQNEALQAKIVFGILSKI